MGGLPIATMATPLPSTHAEPICSRQSERRSSVQLPAGIPIMTLCGSVCVCVCVKLCKSQSRLVDLCDLTSKRLNVCTGTDWAEVWWRWGLAHN